jgi:GTP-binding protein
VGPTELDLAMASWLSDSAIDYRIAANKCDKIPSNPAQEKTQLLDLAAQKTSEIFKMDKSQIFILSAREKFGFEGLRKDIIKFL